jgi:hypothetical protein
LTTVRNESPPRGVAGRIVVVTATFLALLGFTAMATLVDWRRGWLLVILCGVLQDPARKLTPGAPVVMSLSVLTVYTVMLFSARVTLLARARELSARFSTVMQAFFLLAVSLVVAALNGMVTFGFALWRVPALSLLIYTLPIPAVLFGYAWLNREKQIEMLFRFYAALTSVALIGTTLEYLGLRSAALGMVSMPVSIRHLPGIQIRMLAGFYRAPDIMGWHAATLASIGVIMAMRRRTLSRAWPWIAVTAWGFLNCMLSGRRKAVYMVAIFAAAFLWRYLGRLRTAELITFLMVAAVMTGVVSRVMQGEETNVYVRGTATTSNEVWERLEGGLGSTIQQFGFLGAGLGTATQGTQHLTQGIAFGWQEGGLGKLAVELGVPGLMAIAILGVVLLRLALRISAVPDLPETSQVLRAGLFGLIAADIATFMASAQAYSDPLLMLLSAFTVGLLLGTSMLDERALETASDVNAPLPAGSQAVATA